MKLKSILLLTGFLAFLTLKSQTYSTGTVALSSTPGGTSLAYSAKIDVTSTLVTLTLIGSSTSWLGMSFNTTSMDDTGDVVIFDGTTMSDRSFAGVGGTPPMDGTQNWTVTSNTVTSGVRTVIATRALNTGDSNDYVFTYPPTSPLNITYARRSGSLTVGYHGSNSCGTTSVTFNNVLGTTDLTSESKKVSLYPNPAKEAVSFKNADKIQSVDIYESTGRKVKTMKVDGANIDVSDLKSGNYYFEITLKDGSLYYEKLIKE